MRGGAEVGLSRALFGFTESVKPGPGLFITFFFFFHYTQLYCQKNSFKNVLANEIVGFGGLNLFIYF